MSYKKLVNDLLSECPKHCADCKYSEGVEFNCTIDKMAAFAISKLLRKVERLEREKSELLFRAEAAEHDRDEARRDFKVAEKNHMIEVERRKSAEEKANKKEKEKKRLLHFYLENAKSLEDTALENGITHSKLEQVERERDAAIFDLTRAKEAAKETYRLLDDEVHQACDYSLYMALHDSVSDIINWEKSDVWDKRE